MIRRAKISVAMRGKRKSEEHRKNIAISKIGNTNGYKKGEKKVPFSEEHKRKLARTGFKKGMRPWSWKGGVTLQKGYHTPYSEAHRARKRNADGSFTPKEWNELKAKYGFMCLCCKKCEPTIKLEADHVIPLSVGGQNYISNIQPLCKSCNGRKHAKMIDYREVEGNLIINHNATV